MKVFSVDCFISFFAQKTLKMTILTSVWGVQHPNADQNIQHSMTNMEKLSQCFWTLLMPKEYL